VMEHCPLCQLKQKTRWYYQDPRGRFAILDCDRCKRRDGTPVPMVVLRRHTPEPMEDETRAIVEIVSELFPGVRLDEDMRTIKDHWHAHLLREGEVRP
jgi:hypothetical protein